MKNNILIYRITFDPENLDYIGYTSNLKERLKRHFNGRGNKLIYVYYKRHGREAFNISIIEDNITSKEKAWDREKHWIKHFNCTYPNGFNFTNGGEGVDFDNPELKELHRQAVNHPKELERKSKTAKEVMNRHGARDKHSKKMKESANRPEVKEAKSKAMKEICQDPNYRERMRKNAKESLNRPEVKNKLSKARQGNQNAKGLKGYKQTPEHIANKRKARQKNSQNKKQ